MNSILFILISFLLCFSHLSALDENFDPYKTLGVSRTASDAEIRQAYKRLARHWHPDKNSEPNAHDQFTKINAAYEILSDSIKRQDYDEYGTTSQKNHRGFNTNHFRDPFEMFRAHFFQEAPAGAKKIIHAYDFVENILPNSDKKPYLIFGSTNFCFHCRQPMAIFRSMEKQFNEVGIGTGEFNIHDERLSSELGASSIPSLCMVIQGRVYHFLNQDFNQANIKEFVRKSIPTKRFIPTFEIYDKLFTLISSYNQSNRVHALLVTKQKRATLKFVIPCLQYSTRIQCVIFNSSMAKQESLPAYLNQITDAILLFKEDSHQPEIVIKDTDMNLNSIEKVFQSNQLLHVPSITSAHVFDLVCPSNSAKPCFLIIGHPDLFAEQHSSFLHLSKNLFHEYQSRLAYLDLTKQIAFQGILSSYYQTNDRKLLILAARRWFDDNIQIQTMNTEFDLKGLHWQNAKKYSLPVIFDLDEREENIFIRISDRLERNGIIGLNAIDFLRYFSTYLYTYQFWMITISIFLYMYFSRQNSEKKPVRTNQVKVYEFNEPFLQRYTRSGAANVIVLLLIADTPKDECVKNFKREINSIKDSRVVFSILFRGRSSTWLDELSQRMSENQTIEFSSSTILALYIKRKYFVVCNQQQLTDWIDLLLNGNFLEPILVTDWPQTFY